MATENALFKPAGMKAGEDLSSYQYHFVTLDTTEGQVVLLDSINEIAYGVLQNAPASGEAAEITVEGISKIKANAALTVGTFVRPEYVGATDNGKAQDAGDNWANTRGIILEAASAEDDLASILLIGPFPQGLGPNDQVPVINGVTNTVTTAGAATYTAAQLLGGYILRDCAGASRSDVSPTAALLIAAIPQAQTGNRFFFNIKNTSDAAETITLTGGNNVTITGTGTIAQNYTGLFMAEVTGATTVTIYELGVLAH